METIIKEYGKTILNIVVVFAIIAILMNVTDDEGNKGIFNILEASANIETTEYEDLSDSQASQEYIEREPPTVYFWQPWSQLIHGQPINVLDSIMVEIDDNPTAFFASYANEIDFDFFTYKIISITNDETLEECSYSDDGQVIFPTMGTYTLKIKITDNQNKSTVADVAIPVS